MNRPVLAIVGRPNVGKSTLFNRLVGGRPALVHDTPGLTRDRRYGEFEYYGHHFEVIDTGGLDPDAEADVIGAGIHRQARAALAEADAVVFVVDAMAGVTALDEEVAQMLHKLDLPVVCAANKVDHRNHVNASMEVYSLGFPDVMPISAAHGSGCDELVECVVERLKLPKPVHDSEPESEYDENVTRIAFIGKPNAGKSSMVNRLLGTERVLVHDVPGTTTDPVDTPFEFGGKRYVLVDTAGIRRRSRTGEDTERISVHMAKEQIRRADVAVLVVDCAAQATEQDARLAGLIQESGTAVVIALNKTDLLSGPGAGKAAFEQLQDEVHFLDFAPRHLTSALRGDGVVELLSAVDKVAIEYRRRISTAELNKFFAEVCEVYPPPTQHGRSVRIHYLTQTRAAPPTFMLWANRPKYLAESYKRFLVNQLRKRYGFNGSPVRVFAKRKTTNTKPDRRGKGKLSRRG